MALIIGIVLRNYLGGLPTLPGFRRLNQLNNTSANSAFLKRPQTRGAVSDGAVQCKAFQRYRFDLKGCCGCFRFQKVISVPVIRCGWDGGVPQDALAPNSIMPL